MRYSIEAKYRKYVEGYDLLSFAKRLGDKYGKKLMNTATKIGIDVAKTASKRVVQKTPETTGDLIGNKITEKITSVGKTKSGEKKDETNKRQEIYLPPEKRWFIWWCIWFIDDLRYKNGIPKNYKLIRCLDLDLILKIGLEFMISLKEYTSPTKK